MISTAKTLVSEQTMEHIHSLPAQYGPDGWTRVYSCGCDEKCGVIYLCQFHEDMEFGVQV